MKKLLYSFITIIFLLVAAVGCGGQEKQPASKQKEIPLIPHKIDKSMDCADCHKEGKNKAPITKHFDRPNCIQCHKERN